MTTITDLRAELRPDALGIGTATPRLSWKLAEAAPGDAQIAYEFELEGRPLGRVDSTDQVFVAWPASPLRSRERRTMRVRAWTGSGATDWSEPLAVEAGLLDAADWVTDYVSPSTAADRTGPRPAYLLRAGFRLDGRIERARIYASAHGIYELQLNGRPVSDELLAPGWTSYRSRQRYQTYDVTELLKDGDNALGAHLSDGWYRGRIGFHGGVWDNYGTDVALLAQLELTRADGSTEVVPLTEAWRWAEGPVVAASLYDGETYDARAEVPGWSTAGFDDSGWRRPTMIARGSVSLEAPTGVPVRVTEVLRPVSVERRPNGRIRFDFGQNIAGKLAIRVAGERGSVVRLHHAEVLEDDELAIRPLRSAPSIDIYTLRGDGLEEWTPTFTVHGFRYAEAEGWPGEPADDAVVALVMHSDMVRTGWFRSSDPMLDRFHENVVWSMRDNFVDLPTDCPQRDERLGWTGDIQVFAPAASFLYSSIGTLAGWLRDVVAEQGSDGAVPNFVPWVECGFPEPSSAAWGDAAAVVPWVLHERFGDEKILRDQYDSMAAWVDHLESQSDGQGLIREGFQLGDWLDPTAPPEDPGDARTDRYLVATAYLVKSARIVADTAALLGRTAEADHYSSVAATALTAFRREYVSPSGRLVSDTPTALSLALVFDLLETDAQRAVAGRRLRDLVEQGGYVIQTGFVGTPIICDALALVGHVDAAYRLLFQTACPSWLYAVTMGATTVWERWDSMLPDGTVNPGEMTSFNHYALGAVVDFLHRVVAGLAPAAPGYRRMLIAPRPALDLGSAEARLDTPYGLAVSSWRKVAGVFTLDVVVPPGATAEVRLPYGAAAPVVVGSGEHRFEVPVDASAEEDRVA
ncbi:MAG TPA: family 78 glycoside hydrolase catalytic domain [Naasia sp.]|jgi:alpha-L-rhamnosidase